MEYGSTSTQLCVNTLLIYNKSFFCKYLLLYDDAHTVALCRAAMDVAFRFFHSILKQNHRIHT